MKNTFMLNLQLPQSRFDYEDANLDADIFSYLEVVKAFFQTVNAYCHAHALSEFDLYATFRELANANRLTVLPDATDPDVDDEDRLFDLINKNSSLLGLTRPLSVAEQLEISAQFNVQECTLDRVDFDELSSMHSACKSAVNHRFFGTTIHCTLEEVPEEEQLGTNLSIEPRIG
jgi:hypothetical protein